MAKEINLSAGKVALVDDEDYEKLSQYRWFYLKMGYAMRRASSGKRTNKRILMHREIMGFPGAEIDHRDGNGLNNQKENLRLASSQQNKMNMKRRSDNSSGYKGVCWHKKGNKWMSRIGHRYIGLFSNLQEAAKAYDLEAKKLFGEYARLNFS